MDTLDIATIEEQALSLGREGREHLASVLIRSLDNGGSDLSAEEIDLLWIAEAERRYEQWERDPSFGIPGDRVMSEMRELLK